MYEDEPEFPFEINYDKLMESDLMSATLDCARLLKTRSYITAGEYTSMLTTSQLDELVDVANDEEDERFADFLLISEMLARAEGLDASIDMDESMNRVKAIISFIMIETLARKKMVIAHRKNFTFDMSLGHLNIAEKMPDAGDLS